MIGAAVASNILEAVAPTSSHLSLQIVSRCFRVLLCRNASSEQQLGIRWDHIYRILQGPVFDTLWRDSLCRKSWFGDVRWLLHVNVLFIYPHVSVRQPSQDTQRSRPWRRRRRNEDAMELLGSNETVATMWKIKCLRYGLKCFFCAYSDTV